MRHVALWMAKVEKRGKRVQNADDMDKMWTVQEKRASAEEIVNCGHYRRDLLCVNKKWWDQVDGPPIGHFQ